jgi:hypothetical protein
MLLGLYLKSKGKENAKSAVEDDKESKEPNYDENEDQLEFKMLLINYHKKFL